MSDTTPSLKSRLPLIIGCLLILGAGYLAFVPTYRPYDRTGPTDQMMARLSDLADAQRLYYRSQNLDRGQARFAGPAPAVPGDPKLTLCDNAVPQPVTPSNQTWSHPVWRALNYAPTSDLHYAYAIEAAGQGQTAHFTIRAIGDQDCDGVYATFERLGTVTTDGDIRTDLIYVKDEDA
ncbi:MAG: hypothetical protein VX589_04260 [Myxococcota bacterium]|nr:hypothetical protein [Myxococcota bacterium]